MASKQPKDLLAPRQPSTKQPSLVLSPAQYRQQFQKNLLQGAGPMLPGESPSDYWDRIVKLVTGAAK